MGEPVYLTRDGYNKLSERLEHLQTKERKVIAKALEEARALGDLSENAEYDAAKDAQAHNEARIAELESKLANVRFIEDQNIPSDKIFIGASVKLQNLKEDKVEEYKLVSPEEVEFGDNYLSVFSPIGKGLLTHKEGDEISIEVPAGTLSYKVLKIERI